MPFSFSFGLAKHGTQRILSRSRFSNTSMRRCLSYSSNTSSISSMNSISGIMTNRFIATPVPLLQHQHHHCNHNQRRSMVNVTITKTKTGDDNVGTANPASPSTSLLNPNP
eukprot:823288_1